MPTAVLVHGGFHGGWCWTRVARSLRADGWDVHAPSLTGLGDRAHLASLDVGALTHVEDITSLIEVEELDDVILCGHSAGGHTVTAVADSMPERIRHLVYLDGTVPEAGLSTMFSATIPAYPEMFRELAAKHDGVSVPAAVFSAADFGVDDPDDAAWVSRRLTPHPLRAFEEPVPVGAGFASVTRKTYVRAERFPGPYGARMIDKFEQDPGWTTMRWDMGHNVMIIAPEDVADLLRNTVASS